MCSATSYSSEYFCNSFLNQINNSILNLFPQWKLLATNSVSICSSLSPRAQVTTTQPSPWWHPSEENAAFTVCRGKQTPLIEWYCLRKQESITSLSLQREENAKFQKRQIAISCVACHHSPLQHNKTHMEKSLVASPLHSRFSLRLGQGVCVCVCLKEMISVLRSHTHLLHRELRMAFLRYVCWGHKGKRLAASLLGG